MPFSDICTYIHISAYVLKIWQLTSVPYIHLWAVAVVVAGIGVAGALLYVQFLWFYVYPHLYIHPYILHTHIQIYKHIPLFIDPYAVACFSHLSDNLCEGGIVVGSPLRVVAIVDAVVGAVVVVAVDTVVDL